MNTSIQAKCLTSAGSKDASLGSARNPDFPSIRKSLVTRNKLVKNPNTGASLMSIKATGKHHLLAISIIKANRQILFAKIKWLSYSPKQPLKVNARTNRIEPFLRAK